MVEFLFNFFRWFYYAKLLFSLLFKKLLTLNALQLGPAYVDRLDFSDHHLFQAKVDGIIYSCLSYPLLARSIV